VTISFVISACVSGHIEQICSHWMDFHKIWYLSIFQKNCQENSSSIKNLTRITAICVIKTNLMHYLSSIYFISLLLHVLDTFVAIIRKCTVYIQQLVRVVLKRGMFKIN